MTPTKYECDGKNLTGTLAESKILLAEKLTNGALVTPTPVLYDGENRDCSVHSLSKLSGTTLKNIFCLFIYQVMLPFYDIFSFFANEIVLVQAQIILLLFKMPHK